MQSPPIATLHNLLRQNAPTTVFCSLRDDAMTGEVVKLVQQFLLPRDVAATFATCQHWRLTATHDSFWKSLCLRDQLPTQSKPPGKTWRAWYVEHCFLPCVKRINDDNSSYDILMKLLMVGDSGVGKSAFLKRYRSDSFSADRVATIGVDFQRTRVEIDRSYVARVQMWDTAGPERFRTITRSYYRGCHGIILCFDLSHRRSFENIESWWDQVKLHTVDDCVVLLVGMKSDSRADLKDQVTRKEAETKAAKLGVRYAECSSKTGEGVDNAWHTLIGLAGRSIKGKMDSGPSSAQQPVISSTSSTYGSSCMLQ